NSSSSINSKLNELWTEKYKPLSLHQFLGNKMEFEALFQWLSKWKTSSLTSSLTSSSFLEDDDDHQEGEVYNTILLIGSLGIGKTSSIYSLGDQLGFKILEINCSMKRSGREIIDLCGEA